MLQKEALPIHMDNNIIKKISILRGVKKNHNMGKYPHQLIHHICEACHNLRFRSENLLTPYNECLLKARTNQIKHYLRKLTRKNYPIEKKRKILSKPQVGKKFFTAIASFVLPALLSLIIKK